MTLTGPLATFGASWLGWDSASGQPVAHPQVAGVDVARITDTPRKYGLHGTIKPPFFLAEGTRPEALARALEDLCADLAAIRCDGLTLSRMGRFLALTPVGSTHEPARMAAEVVARLDPFRAPPSASELARRNVHRLTRLQRDNLDRWGYPYVMEAFRFHITLTGPLDRAEASAIHAALEPLVAPLLPAPFVIDRLTLCAQDRAGMFHQISHHRFCG